MVVHYDITETYLANKTFEAGAIYYCNDTGNVFLDSVTEKTRIQVSRDIIPIATEADKPIAPLPNKLYCVMATGTLCIFFNGAWVNLGRPQIHFANVTVPASSALEISDNRIISADKAVFIPDLSVADLCTKSTAICSDGKVTISVTASFPIIGEVIIN